MKVPTIAQYLTIYEKEIKDLTARKSLINDCNGENSKYGRVGQSDRIFSQSHGKGEMNKF